METTDACRLLIACSVFMYQPVTHKMPFKIQNMQQEYSYTVQLELVLCTSINSNQNLRLKLIQYYSTFTGP